MAMRVVGVGLGRTGTTSLHLALAQLLDAPCHHMIEIHHHPEQKALWTAAAEGHPDWAAIFDGYAAMVDWPAAGFWRELVPAYPDALVLLSYRASADAWWTSARNTIFMSYNGDVEMPPETAPWMETLRRIFARNGIDPTDEAASKAGYERHLADVRAEIPTDRLLEWTPGDGWAPLCEALGVAIPEEPFPHMNTSEAFRERLGLDAP